jgi:hypothetical protein
MELITPQETARLAELEEVIQRGKETFVEVGTALSEIRNSRIYRQQFGTFEEYCKERWHFSKTQCNRLIDAAEVVANLTPMGVTPESERQARPLAKLSPEQQPAAWEKAREIAKEEGKPVAARHVEAAVVEVMPKEEEPAPLVVDESKTSKQIPNYIPSDALDIWNVAKTHLDRILKSDVHRVAALTEAMEYCQNRLSKNK